MSKEILGTQAKEALVPTGQHSAVTLDQKHAEVTLVALKLTKEELAKLPQIKISQQSTNFNIQVNNNVQINNFNCPQPEATKHQDGPRYGINQGLHTSASARRPTEDKSHGAEYLALAPNQTHKTQQRSRNDYGETVKSPRSPNVQTSPYQGRNHMENTAVPYQRHSTGQMVSRTSQNGSKKIAPANASADPVKGHVRRESSEPESKGFFSRLFHTDSDRDEGSHRRQNSPTSRPTLPARDSNGNHRGGSRESSTVREPPNQGTPQAARRHPLAQSEYMRRTAAERPVARTHHGGTHPTRREEHVGCSHGHPAATRVTHEHNAAALKVHRNANSEGLKSGDIEKCFVDLNSKLGNFNSKIKSGPIRLVLLGGALAVRHLKTGEKTFTIDVLLDPRAAYWRLDRTRQCMAQAGRRFRELDRPTKQQPGRPRTANRFFGSDELRAVVYCSALSGRRVYRGNHLEVYAMNTTHAFEVELRRRGGAGLSNAVAILWALTEHGKRPQSRNTCRELERVRKGAPIPYSFIREVEMHFCRRYGRQGIVNTEWFDPVWKYQDIHGKWVTFPGN